MKSKRWLRYLIQVAPDEALAERLPMKDRAWVVPCRRVEADDYHFSTQDFALAAAREHSMFWARVRVWDSESKRTLAEFRGGKTFRPKPVGESGMSEWQPIESAPKDFNTPVLLWWIPVYGESGVVLARWMCQAHCYLSRRLQCPNEPDCRMGWDNYAGEMTHWMPLPDPPVPPDGIDRGVGE